MVEAPTTAGFDDPIVVFIALVDEALVDTSWASAVFDAPEVFVAKGQLMCEQPASTVQERPPSKVSIGPMNSLQDKSTVLVGSTRTVCAVSSEQQRFATTPTRTVTGMGMRLGDG